MVLEINERNLKQGVLGLVLALVEIIRDTLKLQAVRRMEGGTLTEEETERLGAALMELDRVIEEIKEEHGIGEAVRSVREGLDDIVEDLVDNLIYPRAAVTRQGEELRDEGRWNGATGSLPGEGLPR